MALAGLLIYNCFVGMAVLVLLSIGLSVIFGMMRIINLAHGEFLMLGAYATAFTSRHGVNIWISMLLISPLLVAIVGLVIERCVVRFLYGRMIDTMLATWGLSLFLIGLVTTVFGQTMAGVATPLGSFHIGSYSVSLYGIMLIVLALVTLGGLYSLLRFTRVGLVIRATMERPQMAAAVGIGPDTVYMGTFVLGAALTGLAGGLLAPISGMAPTMGGDYIARAFITVLGGGASIVTGSALASTVFGFIDQVATFLTTPVFGEVSLLLFALILIRLLPQGITGRFFRRGL